MGSSALSGGIAGLRMIMPVVRSGRDSGNAGGLQQLWFEETATDGFVLCTSMGFEVEV